VAACGSPKSAVMVTEAVPATSVVWMAKFAVVAPATTVTLAGTVAEPLLLASVTEAPPAGAGPPSVTVPVEESPPKTAVGFNVKLDSTGGLIVSVANCVPL
jgi:hypothetical protein